MISKTKGMALIGSSLFLATAATTAAAAEAAAASAAGLQEVVVTANRREQNLQDVAATVQAFSAESLKDLRVVSTVDIAQFTPGVVFATTAGEGQKTNIVMRGVGLNSSSEVIEGNVGMYMDDVYISSTSGLTSDIFDVQRVEVLKGPQGTLYGNTVTGGLIHFISREATQEFDAYTNAEFGAYNSRRLEAAIGGGVSDTVAVRFSGTYNVNDGYIKNSLGKDRNPTDAYGGRLQLRWTPSDAVDVTLRGRYSKNDPNTGPSFKPQVAFLNPATGLGEPLPIDRNFFNTCAGCDAGGNPNSISSGSIWEIAANQDGALSVERTGYGAKAVFDLGGTTLTSITDWENVDKFYQEDSDAAPRTTVGQFSDTQADQFQQELRLTGGGESLVWNLGAFYMKRDVESLFAVEFRGSNGVFPPWRSDGFTVRKSKNKSLYGQLEWAFAPTVSLVVGGRYFEETADDNILNTRLLLNGTRTTVTNPIASTKFNDWTGKVGLEWRPTEGRLVYANVSRGVRPGSFQNPGTIPAGISAVVRAEVLDAYELGIKTDLDDVPVRLNASAFYYNYADMQTRAFLGTASYIQNVDSKVKGVELELQAKPAAAVDLSVNAAWTDGTVIDVPRRGLPGVRDTRSPNSPRFMVSGQAKYTGNLASGASWFGLVTGSYRTDSFAEIENNPVQRVPGYSVVNLRAGYRSAADNWEAGAYVNNAFDKEYFNFVGFVTSIGIAQQFPGRPRWYGVYFNYDFK